MTFTSLEYVRLLLATVTLYWIAHKSVRARMLILLGSSLLFYGAWDARYLLLLLGTCSVDFFVAIGIERHRGTLFARRLLILGISVNLFVLGLFKYYDFFADQLRLLLGTFSIHVSDMLLHLVLPIGISFYTFHAISYVIDVYRGVLPATRNYVFYITYVVFFPQLIAGPIMRALPMINQFKAPVFFNSSYAESGMRLILLGLVRKVLVADNLGVYVDTCYSDPNGRTGTELMLATLCFGIQIYSDFAGYSEIGKGSARLFGIELVDNFRMPYLARNLQDFWHRWHVSLTTWFRDYLYKPLGGSRRGFWLTLLNAGLVFVISGFWHGAAWTFIAWGSLHALGYAVYLSVTAAMERLQWRAFETRRWQLSSWALTFVFVMCSWVFFRAQDMPTARLIFSKMASIPSGSDLTALPFGIVLLVLSIPAVEFIWLRFQQMNLTPPIALRWATYVVAVVTMLLYGVRDETRFIYFQF